MIDVPTIHDYLLGVGCWVLLAVALAVGFGCWIGYQQYESSLQDIEQQITDMSPPKKTDRLGPTGNEAMDLLNELRALRAEQAPLDELYKQRATASNNVATLWVSMLLSLAAAGVMLFWNIMWHISHWIWMGSERPKRQ